MVRYTLSFDGKARFKRVKISTNIEGEGNKEFYEVLDYLYEHGAATVEEIENYTGLSYDQVVNKLESFIYWGYVEKLAEQ